MVRFLFTRRWLGLLLAVVVIGVACVELGRWQFRRYAERGDSNHVTEQNLEAPPVPVTRILSTTAPPSSTQLWRVVEATGTYDADAQVLVLYRTRDGAPGVDVVVPLVTDDGTAVLVDRGWVATQGNGNQAADVAPPPTGTVTVAGWVRSDADGGSDQTTPSDGSVRAISSAAIAETVPYPLYDGFLDLTEEEPRPADAPELADSPDLSAGPSFFYGVQWYFFALLAFGFWIYFAWSEYAQQTRPGDEAAPARAPASGGPSP